ncbi:hypothetical protein FRC12_013152 [Ceratobasidium sp. 428]|nr:hypothetical protein FRC12_013152 [Ceratobasidium sp. 428]
MTKETRLAENDLGGKFCDFEDVYRRKSSSPLGCMRGWPLAFDISDRFQIQVHMSPASLAWGTGDILAADVASPTQGTRDRRYGRNATVCYVGHLTEFVSLLTLHTLSLCPDAGRCPVLSPFVNLPVLAHCETASGTQNIDLIIITSYRVPAAKKIARTTSPWSGRYYCLSH